MRTFHYFAILTFCIGNAFVLVEERFSERFLIRTQMVDTVEHFNAAIVQKKEEEIGSHLADNVQIKNERVEWTQGRKQLVAQLMKYDNRFIESTNYSLVLTDTEVGLKCLQEEMAVIEGREVTSRGEYVYSFAGDSSGTWRITKIVRKSN